VQQIDLGHWADLSDGNAHSVSGGNGQLAGGTCVLQVAVYAEGGAAYWSADQAISFSIIVTQYDEATVRPHSPRPSPEAGAGA